MMKQAIIALVLSTLLLVGFGCTGEQAAFPTVTPTANAPTTTPALLPTTMPGPSATATDTPYPSTATPTPRPMAAPKPTLRPTGTAVTLDPSLPLPTGHIYFLWDPNEAKEGLEYNPKHNLYMAIPGAKLTDWSIVPILEDLYGRPLIDISPDQTKLVLSVLENRNRDGDISIEGAARGFDGSNLYVYTFVNGTFERITNDFPSVSTFSWLPDNQTVTYSDDANVFSYNMADASETQLIDTLPNGIVNLDWSPDGQLLAIELYTGELYFFDKTTTTITQVSGTPAEFESDIIAWSSSSEWLASTTQYFRGLFLVSVDTREIIELVKQDFFSVPVWSSDGRWLAFTQSARRDSSSLFVWNAKTGTVEFVREADDISQGVWLPNSDSFIVGLVNDNEGGLFFVDATIGITHTIFQEDFVTKIEPLSWSPDGQWLLFLASRNNETGIYLIHREGGSIYPVLVTTDTNAPYALIWLP